jgi:DNA-binding beta-propeller fold protein YncE
LAERGSASNASPDGLDVYVAASGGAQTELGDSIVHFSRDTQTGSLSYDRCFAPATPGCVLLPAGAMDVPLDLVMSADGRSIYVASAVSNSVMQFSRNTVTGELTYVRCLANTSAGMCVPIPGAPLDGAFELALSPDDQSLYVVAVNGDSLSRFARNKDTGALTFMGCFAATTAQGCAQLPAPFDRPDDVAVSADGSSVFVTSFNSDSVVHFTRDRAGQLGFEGCFAAVSTPVCAALPSLDAPAAVDVSSDGRDIYVASELSDSVAHFVRGSGGKLAYDRCFASDGVLSCTDLPGAPLDGASGVTVSPDGESVYVTSAVAYSVATFMRDVATGQLTYGECMANTTTTSGCIEAPARPLAGATDVALSPDGASAYVASRYGSSLTHFVRELPAVPAPPVPEDVPPPAPVTPSSDPAPPARPVLDVVAPRVTGLVSSKRRFRVGSATTFRYRLSEAAAVAVRIERARSGKPARWVRTGALKRAGKAGLNTLRFNGRIGKRALRPGVYHARFTATDASGNRSTTVSVRFTIAGRP